MAETDRSIGWPGWETLRMIGRGSFGAVYEIERELFGIREKAALKVISVPQNESDIEAMRSDGFDDEFIAAFADRQVRDIVAKYALIKEMSGSANIVRVDDIRFTQQDSGVGWTVFIKMELLKPFAAALPDPVPEEEIVRIAKDLCRALAVCERSGVVHCDMKPQNIFVSQSGDYKLGDFGAARSVKDTGGERVGTFRYMAPEVYSNQAFGNKADLYSLGLVLYWLLNERRTPFLPLPPALPTVLDEERARARRFGGEPIPAPAHGSEALKRIVVKACAFDPEDRYRGAEEMLRDLERLAYTGPHEAAPAPGERARDHGAPCCIGIKDPDAWGKGDIYGLAEGNAAGNDEFDDTLTGPAYSLALRDSGYPAPACSKPSIETTAAPGRESDAAKAGKDREHMPQNASPAEAVSRRGAKTIRDAIKGMFSKKSESSRPAPAEQAAAAAREDATIRPAWRPAEEGSQNVEFSAVAPKGLARGEYAIVNVIMYEKAFRFVVDRLAEELGDNRQEKRSGTQKVKRGAAVKVLLASPDIPIEDALEEGVWQGEHLDFSFAVQIPEDYPKRQVLMQASVYIDGVITTHLKFVFDCAAGAEQKPAVSRKDILSAFISYASQDRKRVAAILQGMQKARPDLDVFFDVESIRSGDTWEHILRREIDRRDVLFLFWSQHARESKWVETEWRYALERKGEEAVEPVPIELPDKCPPPKELENKFFGDKLLYIINSSI